MNEWSGERGKEINRSVRAYTCTFACLYRRKKKQKYSVFFVIIECIILICTITFIYPELYIGNAS